jgi:hypothetical protein
MAHLKPVPIKSKPSVPKVTIAATIHTGRRYTVSSQDLSVLNSTYGIIEDYRMTSQCAEIFPIASVAPVTPVTNQMNTCYFWDTGIDLSRLDCDISNGIDDRLHPLPACNLKANRLILNKAELIGPELTVSNGATLLSLSPRFDFTLSTDDYAAQLGVINLVQSSRIIRLENDDEIVLLDTDIDDAPVLYLENPSDDQPVKFISAQQDLGVTREHNYSVNISQPVPDEVDAKSVATVTVLEQYCSYFMQKPVSLDDDHTIWIPVYAPLSWGWSIRVGRRTDGEWGILRRKLILPTTGHDGLQLPTWSNNTLKDAFFLD